MVFGARKSKACRQKRNLKKRTTKQSVLFFGEGDTEKAFLDYLHSLYNSRKGEKIIQRGCGKGGSHIDILHNALLYKRHSSDFDKIYVLMDNDCKTLSCAEAIKKSKTKLKNAAHRKRVPVKCIYSEPVCIEGAFLNWLGESVPHSASECKYAFHHNYLNEKEKLSYQSYKGIFPKSFLDKARHDSALLNQIISVFE